MVVLVFIFFCSSTRTFSPPDWRWQVVDAIFFYCVSTITFWWERSVSSGGILLALLFLQLLTIHAHMELYYPYSLFQLHSYG